MTTLLLAVLAIVATTCWLDLRSEGANPQTLGRGALLLGGAGACTVLGLAGLSRNRSQHRRLINERVQAVLLGQCDLGGVLLQDPTASALVSNIRPEIDRLRQQTTDLQLQRKNLEIKLRLADAERRQSYTMIHGISDAVLVTNEFDELITANPAAEELFGFRTQDGLRKPLADLLTVPIILHEIREMRQGLGHANRRSFDWALEREGQKRTFLITMTCVTDSGGAFNSLVTVLHDTTRENEVSRMKSEFVSHVSHELRTPLSSIKAYVEMLVDDEAGDEKTKREFYQVIQGEADRLSRLIDNILNISRIESGMTRVNKKPANLTAIAKDVLEVVMPSARDKNLTLIDQLAPVFFQVDVDRDMIYQAVLNLVGNAIKYTPAGGTIRVSTAMSPDQSSVSLHVTDSGVGIPPDAMKHLFEKFYRVEQNKNMAKGSGLGLNLTRQIVEHVHKGKMFVSSTVGQGSTFGFALPIAA